MNELPCDFYPSSFLREEIVVVRTEEACDKVMAKNKAETMLNEDEKTGRPQNSFIIRIHTTFYEP